MDRYRWVAMMMSILYSKICLMINWPLHTYYKLPIHACNIYSYVWSIQTIIIITYEWQHQKFLLLAPTKLFLRCIFFQGTTIVNTFKPNPLSPYFSLTYLRLLDSVLFIIKLNVRYFSNKNALAACRKTCLFKLAIWLRR